MTTICFHEKLFLGIYVGNYTTLRVYHLIYSANIFVNFVDLSAISTKNSITDVCDSVCSYKLMIASGSLSIFTNIYLHEQH